MGIEALAYHDDYQVMYGIVESLYYTPKTNNTVLTVLELNTLKNI